MEEQYNPNQCHVCKEDYDDDPEQVANRAISHLPVRSQSNCKHMVCYTCKANEACSSSAAAVPVVDYNYCDMLRENRGKLRAEAATERAAVPTVPGEDGEPLLLNAPAATKPPNAKVWNEDLAAKLEEKIEGEKGGIASLFALGTNTETKWERCHSAISAEDADEIYVTKSKQIIGLPEFPDGTVMKFCESVINGDAEVYLSESQLGYLFGQKKGTKGNTIKAKQMTIPSGSFAILMALQEGSASDINTKDALRARSQQIFGEESIVKKDHRLEGELHWGPWQDGIDTLQRNDLVEVTRRCGRKDTYYKFTKVGRIFARELFESRGDEVRAAIRNRYSKEICCYECFSGKCTINAESSSSAEKVRSIDSDRNKNISDGKDQDSSQIPVGATGYRFKKYFPSYGIFEGEVVEIRLGAEEGKDRRCRYEDGDTEDLTVEELILLARIGEVGYKFNKKFPGYGWWEGEVVEIISGAKKGKDRLCRYADGSEEKFSLEELHMLEHTASRKRSASSSAQQPSKKQR